MNPLFKVIHERVSDGARVTSGYRGPSELELRQKLNDTINKEWFIWSMEHTADPSYDDSYPEGEESASR